jgi:hypothetical protein
VLVVGGASVAVLHAIDGPLRGRIFGIPDKPRLTVGRYEIYDVIVPEPSISRKHFILDRRQDGVYVTDLGSLNGTQLNGQRISTAKLEHGDLITVGQSVLCYDETDSPTPPVRFAEFQPPMAVQDEIEEVSDADIVELAPEAAAAPTHEVIELPDEIVQLPDEIVELPDEVQAAGAAEPPPTVPMETTSAKEEIKRRRLRTDIGKRKTLRVSTPGRGTPQVGPSDSRRGSGRRIAAGGTPPPVASGPAVEDCIACGRGISREEIDAGEGARTRSGYICGQCVQERQRSGIKDLGEFIRNRRRQNRG